MSEKIPTTLDEAVQEVLKMAPEKIKERIKVGTDSFSNFNLILGMHLRNSWGLWSGSELKNWFLDIGIFHADDMSGIILDKAEANIKGKIFDLQEQVDIYTKHWIEQGVDVQEELKKARQWKEKKYTKR